MWSLYLWGTSINERIQDVFYHWLIMTCVNYCHRETVDLDRAVEHTYLQLQVWGLRHWVCLPGPAALLQCSLPPVTHHLAGCPVPSLPALGSAGSVHLHSAGFYCVDDDYLGGRNDSKFTFSAVSLASFGDYRMFLLFSTYCLSVILMVYFK